MSQMMTASAEFTQTDRVEIRPLFEDRKLPLLVEAKSDAVDLYDWIRANPAAIEQNLLDSGGILFRGFGVDSPAGFEQVISTVVENMMGYVDRSSPRSHVEGNVFTSTDYPAEYPIFLHNENSYAHTWPQKIFFYCHIEPETGGATPIADSRALLQRIDPAIVAKFREKGVRYVRNISGLIGLSWEEIFQTDDKEKVAEFCAESGYEHEWQEDGALRTERFAPAIRTHPKTGEEVWFNHATFFHISTMVPEMREALEDIFEEDELPNNTYYGDGSPIEPETMEALREAYHAEMVRFDWQQGDVIMLDNMLVAHAREPFTGARKILTGLAEPYSE